MMKHRTLLATLQAKIKPNIITYSTMLKGHCQTGEQLGVETAARFERVPLMDQKGCLAMTGHEPCSPVPKAQMFVYLFFGLVATYFGWLPPFFFPVVYKPFK